MIIKRKILICLMVIMVLLSAAVCISAQEVEQELEIDVLNEDNEYDYTAGMIKLDKLLEIHPETRIIDQEYQEQLAQIKEENEEIDEDLELLIEQLNQDYILLVKDFVEHDLNQFADEFGLDVLLINDEIIIGDEDIDPEELIDIQDITPYFESYLESLLE